MADRDWKTGPGVRGRRQELWEKFLPRLVKESATLKRTRAHSSPTVQRSQANAAPDANLAGLFRCSVFLTTVAEKCIDLGDLKFARLNSNPFRETFVTLSPSYDRAIITLKLVW
jgi:hypothetical protein